MRLLIAPILVAPLTSGCVSVYQVPADQPKAQLSFNLRTDSTGTTIKNFIIKHYADAECSESKQGTKIGNTVFASEKESLGPYWVLANMPLTFAVLYSEARFKQNRGCSMTATFTPTVGQKYTVQFAVIDQSYGCGLRILDQENKPVSFSEPEFSCAETLAGKVKNGGAGILNWEIQFQY